MAKDLGGNFDNVVVVRPGKGGKYPRDKAVCSVEMAGEKSAAWENATRSLGVAEVEADEQLCRVDFAMISVGLVRRTVGTRSRCHKPVAGVREPVRSKLSVADRTCMYGGSVEYHSASSVTKLANGDEGSCGEGRDNVNVASGKGKVRKVQFSLVG